MPNLKRKFIFLFQAFFFLFLSFIVSCQCNRSSFTNKNNGLNIIVASTPESLDPRLTTSSVASNISQLLFAPLFIIGEDLLPEPFLAEEVIQISPLIYRIHLKSNLFFHDGKPITAEDVVYTFNSLDDTDVRSPHAEKFRYIENIKAISDKVVQFTLKGSFSPFLIDLCSLGIVSKKHCQNRSEQCMENLVGSGPYRLVSFNKTTETLELKAGSRWFEGPLALQDVEIRVVKDSTTSLLELIKGKANFVSGNISPMQTKIVERYPEKLLLKRAPGLGYVYLAFNLRGAKKKSSPTESEEDRTRKALSNPKVRQALAHAIDIDTILKTKFHGMATRATGMIPPYHWAKSNKLEPLVYNPKLAQTLLDEAGFLDRGKYKKNRFQVTISASQDRFRQSIALIYAESFRKIGINTKVRIQDFSSLYQDIKQGNFEIFSLMWTPVVEPDLFHWIFHSNNIPGPNKGGGNRGAYIDPVIDDLIEQARVSISLEKRKKLYEKIELQLLKTMPYIPLWFEDEIVVTRRNVLNFVPSRTGSLLGIRHIIVEPFPS